MKKFEEAKKRRFKSIIATECHPNHHDFMSVDLTPSQSYGGSMGMPIPAPARVVRLFCTKCGQTRKIE